MEILISTSSFGEFDSKPLKMLEQAGIKVKLNPHRRKLKSRELIQLAKNCQGIIAGTESLDKDVLGQLGSVKVISRCGVGLDNLDLKQAQTLGIKVYNTAKGPTLAVAELTVGLILALLRKITIMDRDIRSGLWEKKMGSLLSGKQVGIIGFGKIGQKTALLLKAMGAEVSYADPLVPKEHTKGFTKLEFKQLLKQSDIVCLHLSYSEQNRRLLNEQAIALMKKGAFLVNCSRGGIVDEQALYSALKQERLSAAAIDVFEQEPYNGLLKQLDNVILTPHIGSYAKEARAAMEIQAVENLIQGLGL